MKVVGHHEMLSGRQTGKKDAGRLMSMSFKTVFDNLKVSS